MQEAGIKTEEGRKEPFTELNYILDCLKQKNLEPALEWATKHKEALLAQVSIKDEEKEKKERNLITERKVFLFSIFFFFNYYFFDSKIF